MSDKSPILETLAEPLRDYLGGKGTLPTKGALITFQESYLKECKRDRTKDFSQYSKLLDDVVEKKNAR